MTDLFIGYFDLTRLDGRREYSVYVKAPGERLVVHRLPGATALEAMAKANEESTKRGKPQWYSGYRCYG